MQRIYHGGRIITMNAPETAQAVLTDGARITAVGDADYLRRIAPGARMTDLSGCTLLPAFIDAHSHLSAYANSFLQVPLEGSADFDDIARRVRRFISDNGIAPGEWVLAKGYDHNELAEGRHPSLELLDACAPDNPLILQHASGHVGVLNSRALSALGVTPDTPAPGGGLIGVKDGALTGYMEENAFFTYLRRAPMPDTAALLGAYERAQRSYAARGISTVQEGLAVRQMIPLYQALIGRDMLRLDTVAYAALEDLDAPKAAFPRAVGRYCDHIRLGGCKIMLDGSPQGRTAWMRTPYLNQQPPYCGYGTMSDAEVEAAVRMARDNGMQLLAHCNGDAAARQYLSALAKSPMPQLRPVMIHAQLLGIDQLDEVRALGVIPSFFVAHVYHWGDAHIRNFGMERASAISPAGAALSRGIRMTFHQDSPVIEPDMLETVWCAVNRRTRAGTLLGPEQRIPVYEALKAVTINAAYQYFEEDEKGSIEPGKRADFAVLDGDPLSVSPDVIRDIRVLQTVKDGELIAGEGDGPVDAQ